MKTPTEIIVAVQDAFCNVSRPQEFIYGTCRCEECEGHNQTMSLYTPETITLAVLGNPGSDPMCFANDQAFRYYLPAMIRLAFDADYYLDQLLFHLNCPGRVEALNCQEVQAILDALWGMVETLEQEIFDTVDHYSFEAAIERLEQRLELDADVTASRQ